MITFKDFAGNARTKKKKQAGTQKKVNKVKKLGIREGRQVFEYIGKVIKPAAERQDYYKEGFRMPNVFWKHFFKHELRSSQVHKHRMVMYKRAYDLFMQRRRAGETGYYRILAGPQGHQGHSQGIQPNILGFPQGFQPNLLGFLKVSPP